MPLELKYKILLLVYRQKTCSVNRGTHGAGQLKIASARSGANMRGLCEKLVEASWLRQRASATLQQLLEGQPALQVWALEGPGSGIILPVVSDC